MLTNYVFELKHPFKSFSSKSEGFRRIVSSRELRRGESDEEMHSCLPTLAESDFVETKAGSKSRFTSYKKPKYSEKGSVLGV